jgi:hypothetical protein
MGSAGRVIGCHWNNKEEQKEEAEEEYEYEEEGQV